ncbi:bifunctional nuclease family protein [Candidatus Poribacteria bacterium]|nr:bifunctional nuclease family protein [Candidatus Poribacteria bacterium]
MQISDAELVRQCKDGDRDAFNALIRRYQHAVYGLCYHFVGDFADAQDLTQETFVRVYLDLHQIQHVSKFSAWLRQVATRVCQMWLRRKRPQTQATIDETAESDLVDQQTLSPAEEAVTNEMRGFVAQAISHLSEAHRLAVTMYYIDGLSYREIGEFLDVPQTTIKNRLHRARKQLKKELLKMVEKEFESQRLSDEFSEQVLQEVEVAFVGGISTIEVQPASFSVESKLCPIDWNDPTKSLKDFPSLFERVGISLSQCINITKKEDGNLQLTDEDNKRIYLIRQDKDRLIIRRIFGKEEETPIVHLQLKDNPDQRLPIWIGPPEAVAISMGVQETQTPRPMTHELMLNLLEAANAKIRKVIVSDMQEGTYIAKMIIDFNGTVKEIDCRPSDAIALAVRAKLPIFVAKKVTDKHGYNVTDSEKAEKSDSEKK